MAVQAGAKGLQRRRLAWRRAKSQVRSLTNNTNGAYYVIRGALIAAKAKGEDMNVSVGEHWEKFVESAVREGRYGSTSEVVREGLRLVEEREAKLKALREEINAAIESGPRLTADEVSAGLDARMKQWKPKRA
jgi:antitoxin ParD1/3/4